jgi:CBS domain containing-hemolysin-like protein
MKLITVRDIMTPVEKIAMISPYATVRELINMMDEKRYAPSLSSARENTMPTV